MLKSKSDIFNGTVLAVAFLGMLSQGNSAFTVMLRSLTEEFSNIPELAVQLMSQLPTITGMVVPVITGLFVGRKIGYRPVIIVSCILYLFGALAPYFVQGSFFFLLLCRFLYGVGVSVAALRFAVINARFPEIDRRSKVMGAMGIIASIAGMVMTSVIGIVSDINLYYGFLVYAIAFIPLFLTVFAFEDPYDKDAAMAAEADAPKKEKKSMFQMITSLKGIVWALLIFYMLLNILASMRSLGQSYLVAERNFGANAMTGYIATMQTVGALVAGVFMKTYVMKTKRYALAVDMLMMATSFAMFSFGNHVIWFVVGSFIMGIAVLYFQNVIKLYIGDASDNESFPFANAMTTALGYMGGFIGPFVFALFKSTGIGIGEYGPVFTCTFIGFVILTIALFVINPLPKETREKYAQQ